MGQIWKQDLVRWQGLRHIGLGRVFLGMWNGLLEVECAFGNGGGVFVRDLLLLGCQ